MIFIGRGGYWLPDGKRIEFVDGIFETTDPKLIAKLTEAGYKPLNGKAIAASGNPTHASATSKVKEQAKAKAERYEQAKATATAKGSAKEKPKNPKEGKNK